MQALLFGISMDVCTVKMGVGLHDRKLPILPESNNLPGTIQAETTAEGVGLRAIR
jgi:hypothetical protein